MDGPTNQKSTAEKSTAKSPAPETAALVSPTLVSPTLDEALANHPNTQTTRRTIKGDQPNQPSNPQPDEPIILGIMASGSGSNFEAIAAAIDQGLLNARIALVIYNNPGAKVADRAKRLNIPAQLLDHRQFETREALDDAIATQLKAHQVNWVIMAGWMRRVTERLLAAFPARILNIHPSLLPSFPGMHAVEQALNAGVKIAGCSVHRVELIVDSGPIIMQAAVPVLPGDSVETLQARIQVQEHRIFPQAIALAVHQAALVGTTPQNHATNT